MNELSPTVEFICYLTSAYNLVELTTKCSLAIHNSIILPQLAELG